MTAAAGAAKSLQSCPTLCDPIDGSPPGSPVPGILQARTLEWASISFSNAWKWKVKVKSLSRVRLLAIPWTAAYQAPPSMGFSRKEYWSGVPLPSLILWLHQYKDDYINYLLKCFLQPESSFFFLFAKEHKILSWALKNIVGARPCVCSYGYISPTCPNILLVPTIWGCFTFTSYKIS